MPTYSHYKNLQTLIRQLFNRHSGDVEEDIFRLVAGISNPLLVSRALSQYLENRDDDGRAALVKYLLNTAIDLSLAHSQLSRCIDHLVRDYPSYEPLFTHEIAAIELRMATDLANHGNDLHREQWIAIHAFSTHMLNLGRDLTSSCVIGLEEVLRTLSVSLESAVLHTYGRLAAAQYIIHATYPIAEACRTGRCGPLDQPNEVWGTRGPRWTGEAGYSRERWDFWRKQLQAALEEAQADINLRLAVQFAVDAMDLAMRRPQQ